MRTRIQQHTIRSRLSWDSTDWWANSDCAAFSSFPRENPKKIRWVQWDLGTKFWILLAEKENLCIFPSWQGKGGGVSRVHEANFIDWGCRGVTIDLIRECSISGKESDWSCWIIDQKECPQLWMGFLYTPRTRVGVHSLIWNHVSNPWLSTVVKESKHRE